MGSRGGEGSRHWSIFDSMKNMPASPEALMAEINSAISSHEYARSTVLLQNPSSSSSSYTRNKVSTDGDGDETLQYDARKADEAYRAGLASLAAGKLDKALNALNIALSSCPPDKTSAVAKLESLISLTSQQLQKTRK
ncbi:uncharacterized protein LOC124939993 [Impatiens glandulifera]|uniref:uncharacterized protein LOC124939993 n=1 Tax=Impatiens glandulifera TaxID=253017 RepID=UPI001FB09591|nr:uncharacterized protein LOC124939993 [Impatiens glandulifera]XP_047336422.1 uncharacterized protein LOC124939993 [Impatiens glandulifera]